MLSRRRVIIFSLPLLTLAGCSFLHRGDERSEATADAKGLFPIRKPASIEDTARTLDPNKKTVCTITINSEQEKEVFQRYLRPSEFNFIELTPEDRSDDQDWFGRACRSGVQCDVMVISGHFGGTFFGKSGYRLTLEELETWGCSSECDGLLSRPKEVFLFGCNTLAGKNKDHRTREEYIAVLREDGFTQRQAEQVAAFRYSPVGQANADRMRRAFKGVTKLYGFNSVAPSGKNIDASLAKYLKSVGDYGRHLQTLKNEAPNQRLASYLKWSSFVETPGWGRDVSRSPVCYLNNDKVDRIKKLQWVKETFQDKKKRVEYAPHIERFLRTELDRKLEWSAEENRILTEIAGNTEAKSDLEGLLHGEIQGMAHIQVSLANLMRMLNWWDQGRYSAALRRIVGDIMKPNMSIESRDLICSLGTSVNFALEDLPDPALWNDYLVSALGCAQIRDERILQRLVQMIQPGVNIHIRRNAWQALGQIGPSIPAIRAAMIQSFQAETDEIMLNHIASSLRNSAMLDESLTRALVGIARGDSNSARQLAALDILGTADRGDLKTSWILFRILADRSISEELVRLRAGLALGERRPNDPKMIQALFALVKGDPEYSIKYQAADVMAVLPVGSDPQLVAELLALLQSNPDMTVRIAAASVLRGVRPSSESVQKTLLEVMKKDQVEGVISHVGEVLQRCRLAPSVVAELKTLATGTPSVLQSVADRILLEQSIPVAPAQ